MSDLGFGGSWEKDDHVLGWLIQTKYRHFQSGALSKTGSISCDEAFQAFQCIYKAKIDDEREHYKVNMYRGESESNPDDIPLSKLRSHHYRCLRAMKAFYEKSEEVSKRDAECSFWMLFTDWKDEVDYYKPERGRASDIDADELPIKWLQPCMYTYFRILGGYWCARVDGLGFPELETVDGQVGYTIRIYQEETQESHSERFEMSPEEIQKNFEKFLNVKHNITRERMINELGQQELQTINLNWAYELLKHKAEVDKLKEEDIEKEFDLNTATLEDIENRYETGFERS